MERMNIAAQVRSSDVVADDVRLDGLIPAVIYGGTREQATSLSIDRSAFLKLKKASTPSTLVTVDIAGEVVEALIGDVQYDPLTDEPTHVDFIQTEKGRPVKAKMTLKLIGDAPAVKLGGMLMINRTNMLVQGPPESLVPFVEIDLGQLDNFDKTIRFENITLPEGIVLMEDARVLVANVRSPKRVQSDAAAAEASAQAPTAEQVAANSADPKPEQESA